MLVGHNPALAETTVLLSSIENIKRIKRAMSVRAEGSIVEMETLTEHEGGAIRGRETG